MSILEQMVAAILRHREDEAEEPLRKPVKEWEAAADPQAQVQANNSVRKAEMTVARQFIYNLRTECSNVEAIDKLDALLTHNAHVKNLYLGYLRNLSPQESYLFFRNFFEPQLNGNVAIRRIAPVLQKNCTLISTDLTGNRIGRDGAIAIAEALKTNRTLRVINLARNEFGLIGGLAIAETLETNNTLTSIDLSHNEISFEGITAIAEALKINRILTKIMLTGNECGDGGAIAIAEALKINRILTLITLTGIEFAERGAIAIAEALKLNQTLTSITLGHHNFGDAGAAKIAEMLKINESLTEIDLTSCNLGPQSVAAIATALLETNRTLTRMWLAGNSIGREGVASLALALEKNQAVTHLELGDENQAQAMPYLQRNLKLKQQGCVAFLVLHRRRRGLWGTVPKEVLDMILSKAYPDIFSRKSLNRIQNTPMKGVEDPSDFSSTAPILM